MKKNRIHHFSQCFWNSCQEICEELSVSIALKKSCNSAAVNGSFKAIANVLNSFLSIDPLLSLSNWWNRWWSFSISTHTVWVREPRHTPSEDVFVQLCPKSWVCMASCLHLCWLYNMDVDLLPRPPRPPYSKWVFYFVAFQSVVLLTIVCLLLVVVPEIATTLRDVRTTMPEMKTTIEKLTYIVPEVRRAIQVLDKLCTELC